MDGGNLKIDPLLIDFNWLERDFGDEIERAFFADITLAVGGNIVTRVEDRAAKTVRSHLRGCAYQLAIWFAANWWRLRWEPEPSGWHRNTDWRLSHCMASAGYGYIWPDATFACDGDFCDVIVRSGSSDVAFEPIREVELGLSAVEEVAAQFRHSADARLAAILKLRSSSAGPQTGGFRASVPRFDRTRENLVFEEVPWKQAARLAEGVRKEWGLDQKPISDLVLADLLKIEVSTLTAESIAAIPLPLAFRDEASDHIDVYLDRPRVTTRRFTVSRLVGDFLYFRNREPLIPATKARTARQKFQRAFAQEFLCPIDALLGKIQTSSPDDDDYSAAAEYFGVSPRMVATTLVNHGKLAREALAYVE